MPSRGLTPGKLIVVLALGLVSLQLGCKGGNASPSPPPPQPTISVSISPSSANVLVGGTQQFAANVQNTTNTTVTWQVNGVTGGNATLGTISATGFYAAPDPAPSPATVTVTAVSQADTTKSGSATVSLSYATPTLTGVSPASVIAGAGDTPVTLTGTGFSHASTINVGGSSLLATFDSTTQLRTTIPAGLLTVGVIYTLTVSNPNPGGGISASVNFTVNNPTPFITSVSPSTIVVGSFTLTVDGGKFVPGAHVNFTGMALNTIFVSPTRLTATGTAAISQVGTAAVSVTNPDPGSSSSGTVNVTVLSVTGGGSGSTAIIVGTVNGKLADKAYIPLTSLQKVAVLNVDSASSTALVTSIPMPSGYQPNATAANQATMQVVVISFSSPDVQIIDAKQDKLVATHTAPVNNSVSFSGGSCKICGVLVDPSTNKAILDTAVGYLLLDLAAGTFSPAISDLKFAAKGSNRQEVNTKWPNSPNTGDQAVAETGDRWKNSAMGGDLLPTQTPEETAVPPRAQQSAQEQQPQQGRNPELARRRQEWFYQQRAYPLGRIPAGARARALEQLDRMLEEQKALGLLQTAAEPSSIGFPGPAIWTLIGPQPTNNPFNPPNTSGRVTALAVDPTDTSIVYLGAAEGGIWKTSDGGVHWSALTDREKSLAVGSIAIDPKSCTVLGKTGCQTIYIGTGEENFNGDAYYGAGVLKSTNGGDTWTLLGASNFGGPFSSSGFDGGFRIGAIAVHPSSPQILLAAADRFSSATTSGIYRSSDAGQTWTLVLSGASGTGVFFNPASPNIAYAALGSIFGNTNNGVYKSTDAGANWGRADATGTTKLPTTNVGRIEIAIAPSNASILYAAIQDSTPPDNSPHFGNLLGFFKSNDGGQNWIPLANTPHFCDGPSGKSGQCWYDLVVRVHPSDPSTVFAGGSATSEGSLIRSRDGGMTWEDISPVSDRASIHVDQHAMAFSNPSAGTLTLYVGNDGGVYSTTDINATSPVNWKSLNATIAITQFYPGHSVHPSDENIGFGGTQDNGTQKYSGNVLWDQVTCGDGAYTAVDASLPSTVYSNCQEIDIRKSVQNGAFGTFLSSQENISLSDRSAFIPPLVIDPSTPQRLYFGTFRIWQTTNGASSWTSVSDDLTGTGTGSSGPIVSTIAVALSNSNVVYAGTNNGRVAVCETAGAAAPACWQDVSTGLPNRVITQIAVNPADGSGRTAYVAFSGFSGCPECDGMGHIFKTTNAGTAWAPISGNLPDTPVNSIVVDPDVADTLYLGTDIGVFQTSDGGKTWSSLNLSDSLPRVAVLSLALREPSRTLRAATHGRSAWLIQLTNFTPPPGIRLTSISPATAPVGSPGVTITLDGVGFSSSSQVQWNGSNTGIGTAFVASNRLTANIPASLLTAVTTAQVNVFDASTNPVSTSNALIFTLTANPMPFLSSLTPTSAFAGSEGFILTVNGANFVNASLFAAGSTVFFNGHAEPTTFVSNTELTAMVPASDIQQAGAISVVVQNPSGQTSNFLLFFVNTSPSILAATAENFAFNPGTHMVLNPTYGVSNFTGLQAIRLEDNSVWNYNQTVGSTPDSAAIDFNTNIAVIPDEFTDDQYLINMQEAIFLAGGFSAPKTVFRIPVSSFFSCQEWTMVSVESRTHLLFLANEFGGSFGGSLLACAAIETMPTATVTGAPPMPAVFHWGQLPVTPDGFAWLNAFDPHGIAVFTSVVDGKAYGFLVNRDQTWVARIDLAGVRDAALKVGGGPNEVDLTPFVFFLKTQ